MRPVIASSLLLVMCCTSTPPPAPAPPPPPQPLVPFGLTTDEEARILALEDRREYDPTLTADWLVHPNSLHRARIALALGRIGPQTFIDVNGNGERDPGEKQAGVDGLATLASDPDRNVRMAAAFALGDRKSTRLNSSH